jgi:hypothetical protein
MPAGMNKVSTSTPRRSALILAKGMSGWRADTQRRYVYDIPGDQSKWIGASHRTKTTPP